MNSKEEYLKDRLNFIKRHSIYGLSVDEDKLKRVTKELFKTDCFKPEEKFMNFKKFKEILDAVDTQKTIEAILTVEHVNAECRREFNTDELSITIEDQSIVKICDIVLNEIDTFVNIALVFGANDCVNTLTKFENLLKESEMIEEIGDVVSSYPLDKYDFGTDAIFKFNRCGWIEYQSMGKTKGLSKQNYMRLGIYAAKLITSIKSFTEVYEKIIEADKRPIESTHKTDISEFIKRRRERIEKNRNNRLVEKEYSIEIPVAKVNDVNKNGRSYPSDIFNKIIPDYSSENELKTVGDVESNNVKFIRIPDTGIEDLSDGYHTFNDLYYQRCILFATIVNNNLDISWKSYRHEDGELCFGGGWFIVGIDTPEGPYTYHYEKKYWNLFKCEELECGKHWDGHTDKDVTRLLSINTKNNEDEYLEQNILSLKYREDEYMKVEDILDRFLTIDKYFKHTKWNLSQILSNLDMVMSIKIESEN